MSKKCGGDYTDRAIEQVSDNKCREVGRMDMYDALFSPSGILNDQVARHIFELLPDEGPLVTIMDKNGNYWPSDSERFSELNLGGAFLKELCSKIDDGAEPVITQAGRCSMIAAQLTTERTNCGYAVVILPDYTPESTLVNIDLIELILKQINLISTLIEKNNILYELQMKHFNSYSLNQKISN